MDDLQIARAVHAAAVVVWIGGLAMATTVILPLVRGKEWPAEKRLILFEAIERRFVWQARTAVVLVGLSGFYMVSRYDLWNRFAVISFWWMHAMVAIWLIFTLLLFVIEPFILHSRVRRAPSGDEPTFTLLHLAHWTLLILSIVTVLAAVAGSHGAVLTHWGGPPALPGRQQKFDVFGSVHRRISLREQPSTREDFQRWTSLRV